jgi:hypothetical protein
MVLSTDLGIHVHVSEIKNNQINNLARCEANNKDDISCSKWGTGGVLIGDQQRGPAKGTGYF